MQYIDSGKIKADIALLDSTKFDPRVYSRTGAFVVRGIIPRDTIATWQQAWHAFYQDRLAAGRDINPFNPVVVNEEVPEALEGIHRCPQLIDLLGEIYPDLALYVQRFLLKDAASARPVFLHHDFGYDLGWPEKTSAFIPLTSSNEENGGLACYPGTHRLGYMGDVGEFNRDVIAPDWPRVCPALEPGDVFLVHECTWHESPAPRRGPDRVLVQVTYQPASDPSGVALLRGSWRTDIRISAIAPDSIFRRSRASRLRELQLEVDRMKAGAKKA